MAYIGVITYDPLILTFDPNFLGHPSTGYIVCGRSVHFLVCSLLPQAQMNVYRHSLSKIYLEVQDT